ncbi:BglG family transcription antiterminator [Lactovum odontotermitis]
MNVQKMKLRSNLTARGRVKLMMLFLLNKEDYLGLDDFVYFLDVSKNTALSSIKNTKTILNSYGLILGYSRQAGYEVVGDEWEKRRCLLNVLYDLQTEFGQSFLSQFFNIEDDGARRIRKSLREIEQFLEFKYTDEDYYPLVFFLDSVLYRIKTGHIVSEFPRETQIEIGATQEFQAVSECFDFISLTDNEKIFITLHLLGSRTKNVSGLSDVDLPDLKQALWQFIENFERDSFVLLPNKEELIGKLINHIKSSYYRIKYHLTFQNVLYDTIISKYHVLHEYVKNAISPLEVFFETQIADQEAAYLTIFMGGELRNYTENQYQTKTIRAIIACPNGTTMSKMLENDLRQLFPEIIFYKSISLRDLDGFILPYDVVFSTVDLTNDKPVFVVAPLLNEASKLRLRQQVLSQIFHLNFEQSQIKEIMKLFKSYHQKFDEKMLENDLSSLLLPQSSLTKTLSNQAHLTDVLGVEQIIVLKKSTFSHNWLEVLRLASQNLKETDKVDDQYIRAVQVEYADEPEHIMLKQRVLLPHLNPELYKQQLGVCLVVLKEGLNYQKRNFNLVMMLTTPNAEQHLQVLLDIKKIAENETIIEQLSKVRNAQEAFDIIERELKNAS